MDNASEPYQRRALHPCRTGLPLIIAHIADPEVETGYADPSILPRRAQVSQFRPTARAHQHRAPPARDPTQNRCEDRQPRPLAESIAARSRSVALVSGSQCRKPIEMSDMCVLIKHREQWLLWDTGYPDAVADQPVDTPVGHATRAKKLAAQLGELNLKPSDIAFVAVSHTHGDHVGNVDLFPAATLLIQKAEVDWAFAEGKPPPFKKDRLMRLLTGDFDVL